MPSSATTPDPRRWAALGLLAVAQFVVVLDASIMNIALPSVGQAMHVSTDTLSWVVNAYVLAFGGLLLLGGRLADLLGRRRVFVGGLVVFGLASLAGGLSSSAEQLIAARAVQGVGAAALAPAALSTVTALFAPGAERNRALSIWGAVAGSGGVAGVLLGGLLTSGLGWEWVLFVNVPVALGAAVLAPRLFGESRGVDAGGRVDVAGAVTVTAGTVAGVYALVQADGAGWASVQTLGLLGAAVALLGAFLVIETRVARPLMPLSIFRSRHVLAANVTMIAAGAAMFGLFFFLSLYLQQVLGYSALEAGVSQLPLAGSLVVAAGGAGALVERLGVKMVLMMGTALFAGGMLWFAQLPVDGQFLVNILGPSLLVGLGLALSFVALTIASVTDVQDTNYGLASGLINTSQQIGGALGLAILTALADQRTQSAAEAAGVGAINDGYRLALLVGAGLAAIAFVAAAVLTPGGRRRGAAEVGAGGAEVVAA
ncbi:MAG TPA: DHA2 family efflux MFS transporter permease subunit [Baekduia sp.]|jgi:EmrB/QacA subfamily drug resistance transporter